MKRYLTAVLIASFSLFAPAAHAAVDIIGKAINHPAADQWGVYGTGEKHQMVKDTGVNGGSAFQVTSAGASLNPWDIQAGVTTSKAVKKGDVILLAFWARAVTPQTVNIPAVLQQTSAPYTRVGAENLTITPDWKLYYVSGPADQDYAAGTLGASVQLATAAQTVALGPVFLMNYGPGYNPKYLPHNIP